MLFAHLDAILDGDNEIPVMEAAGAVTGMPALESTTARALSARLYRAQKLAAQ